MPSTSSTFNTKTIIKKLLLALPMLGVACSTTTLAAGVTTALGNKAGDQDDYAATNSTSLSADGRYLTLTASSGFIPHVFIYDRFGKTTKDVTPDASVSSYQAKISANGQYVALVSPSGLTADDVDGITSQIFLYDTRGKTMRLLSKATDGALGNAMSAYPNVSSDGQVLVFLSSATNLVANDTNETWDLFLRDRKTNKTIRIDVSSSGAQAGSGVTNGTTGMSADGRYVAFSSYSDNLVTGDTSSEDVFLRDVKAGQTTRISAPVKQTGFDGQSRYPSVSSDGRFIAFQSGSSKLTADDSDDTNSDIFVYDRSSKKATKITKNADGNSLLPKISGNGRYVAFMSQASNLVANDTNGAWDTFVYDRQTDKTARVNVTPQGAQSSGDGLFMAVGVDVSADGRFISFESAAKDLSGNDTDQSTDVFLRDRLLNTQKSADIKMTLSAPTTVTQGQSYSYTVTVANLGASAASSTTAVVNLPTTLTVEAVTANQGSCVKSAVTVCQLGAINSGASKQIQIKVKALTDGAVTVSGSAESVEKDGAYGNNVATKTVTVN